MRIHLRVCDMRLRQPPEKVVASSFHLPTVLAAFAGTRLWQPIRLWRPFRAKRPMAIKSLETLLDESSSWTKDYYILSADAGAEKDYAIEFSVVGGDLSITQTINVATAPHLAPYIVDDMVQIVERLTTTLGDLAIFGSTLEVAVLDVSYPRPRPIRWHRTFGNGNAVDIFSRVFHESFIRGDLAALEKLSQAPLPAGVTRVWRRDLLIIQWVDAECMQDVDKLRARLSARDRWMANVLSLPPAPGWNDSGDEKVAAIALTPHPPLTSFDAPTKQGIKAIHIEPDGRDIDEQLQDVAKWIEEEKLPDGTPVASISIILPDRERALLIGDRARSLGVAQVYYATNEGWWNPFPEGEWISE